MPEHKSPSMEAVQRGWGGFENPQKLVVTKFMNYLFWKLKIILGEIQLSWKSAILIFDNLFSMKTYPRREICYCRVWWISALKPKLVLKHSHGMHMVVWYWWKIEKDQIRILKKLLNESVNVWKYKIDERNLKGTPKGCS